MTEAEGRDPVLLEAIGAVRIATFNRPEKLNAADLAVQERLVARVREVAADSQARALILTGAGRAFSAGGDRDTAAKIGRGEKVDDQDALGRVHHDTIESLLRLEIPVIAAVNGFAVGYAAGVVALCDMVVMGEDAYLWDPHVRYGIAATSGVQMVWPRLTSMALAKEILLMGRKVPASEALRIGLANRVCQKGEELTTALEIAKGFAELPPAGVAATKRAFNQSLIEEAVKLRAVTGTTR